MAQYDRQILNTLLDSYERSLLFTGENKVSVSISFSFQPKTIPAYFETSSLAYEEIHENIKALEQREFLTIVWKGGKEDHIISKVLLNTKNLDAVYDWLHRIPKQTLLEKNSSLLTSLKVEYGTPISSRFMDYLQERIVNNRSVKEYIELSDLERTEQLIKALSLVEQNETPCYVREFSIRHFSDSKLFESMCGRLGRILHTFGGEDQERSLAELLAEYQIYDTPDYVYFKGNIVLETADGPLSVKGLQQGIGLSGDDLPQIRLCDVKQIKRVFTIENLTTFFRWQAQDSLILYLGGYHNARRRELLRKIYRALPQAEYLHFGDIDVGGFAIYEDLCAKTQIPFVPYRMDVAALEQYAAYTKVLTEHDRARIEAILAHRQPAYAPVLVYMLAHNVKLEQECMVAE